jgi:hypothetical protein
MLAAGSFFDGGYWFNATSFVLGIVGFAVTIVQIVKARRASDAAREAAVETRSKISGVLALVDASKLVSLADEVKIHLHHQNFGAAEIRAYDLMSGIAQFRTTKAGKAMKFANEWQDIYVRVDSVRELAIRMRDLNAPDDENILRCIKTVAEVSGILNAIVSQAREKQVS